MRSEFRKTTPFTGIDSRICANVNIVKSKIRNIQITAQENILPIIQLEERNGLLVISSGAYEFQSDSIITITIYLPSIDEIRLSDKGTISSQCPAEKICLSGNGIILCKGKIRQATIILSGSGEIFLGDMKLNVAEINITGSGNIHVNASDNLGVVVAGSGFIYYKGKPLISSTFSGDGRLISMK